MEWLFYIQLFVFTAGSLLYLFLVVLLAGLRKPRLPESLLFFAGISLFLFYAGGLLGMNATITYDTPPVRTMLFAFTLSTVGLAVLPALLVHAPVEFLARAEGKRPRWAAAVALFYLPAAYFFFVFAVEFWTRTLFDALEAVSAPAWRFAYGIWLALALLAASALQQRLARHAVSPAHLRLGRILAVMAVLAALLSLGASFRGRAAVDDLFQLLLVLLLLVPVAAASLVTYHLVKQSLLGTGIQRSLVYSVAVAFLALIYLTLASRLSRWLEPLGIPAEATVSILLFVFVLFLEPVQRRVARVLERAFRREAENLQHLTAEIQQVARAGNVDELLRFAESRISEALGLADVRIVLRDGAPDAAPGFSPAIPGETAAAGADGSAQVHRVALRSGGAEIGALEARYHGEVLSGETQAALGFLAEQLPAALDLCRLIHEKVRLERELAERQRLAALGQMAASISHNLKNPLSSMKTLLQLQLERADLPEDVRRDTARVLEELDRLSGKLAQLLEYAKPSVRREGAGHAAVNVRAQVEQAVALLRPEAERRGIRLELADSATEMRAQCTEDALHDVVSNLLVNAVEATPSGGAVSIRLRASDGFVILDIADDGPGIPPNLRERIFDPFFTTKPRGTGLGLAIVKKRLAEMGGSIHCESPGTGGRKTSFIVLLP
jgi:signal transduction histidine kinase